MLWLIALAASPREYVSAAIYSGSLVMLFGFSAAYHTLPWPPRPHRVMKRLDHSTIFLLIAGSYTPFCLLALSNLWGLTILSVVWSLAAAGVLLKLFWIDAPRRLGVVCYLGLGWLGLLAAPALASSVTVWTSAALLTGGLLYTAGAVVYGSRRPDPFPSVFGYHEVFHLFVIAGAAIHYGLVVALFAGVA